MNELCNLLGVYDPTATELVERTVLLARCQGSIEEGVSILSAIIGDILHLSHSELVSLVKSKPVNPSQVFALFPNDFFPLFEVMRKRELQLEHLRSVEGFRHNREEKQITASLKNHPGRWKMCEGDIAKLYSSIKDTIKVLEDMIPEKELKQLNVGEAEVFTGDFNKQQQSLDKNQLQPIASQHFAILKEIVESEQEESVWKNSYILSLYHGQKLGFESLSMLKAFADRTKCPCGTVLRFSRNDSYYNIFCSFTPEQEF